MATKVGVPSCSSLEISNSLGYHAWRRLGDVISSLFALGYHDDSQGAAEGPTFLRHLRNTAFARTYSADKNVSIFLGRPPRLLRKYCSFRVPESSAIQRESNGTTSNLPVFQEWTSNGEFDYSMDTRWSACCASFKEDVLNLIGEEDQVVRTERAR